MAVVLDTAGTLGTTSGTPGTTVTGVGTVGSGSNRALVVQLSIDVSTVTGISVKWDPAGANQTMTLISTQDSGAAGLGKVQLYGLVNPTTGSSKNITASWTGSSDAAIFGVSYTGVDQTGGGTSFVAATPTTGNSPTPSITVTSATGNAVLDCMWCEFGGFVSNNQTQTFFDASFGNGSGGGQRAAGAASVTCSWVVTSGQWASVGVNVVASTGGGGNDGVMWLY